MPRGRVSCRHPTSRTSRISSGEDSTSCSGRTTTRRLPNRRARLYSAIHGRQMVETRHTQRRLAAILAADVAGYSRLMGADEEGTLARLNALRAELIDPSIGQHNGRIVKTTGDGLLVEFASVVDAMRCAVTWQSAMADRAQPAETRIDFRI